MDRRIIFNKEDCGGVCIIGEVILMDRNDVYTSFRVKTVVFHLLNVKKKTYAMLSSAFSLLFCVLSISVCLFGYIFFLLKKIYQSISYIKTERIKRIFPDLYDVA